MSKIAQRRICERQRQAEFPIDPDDYDEIDPAFVKTFDGQQFLLRNIETENGRIMIFSTITNIKRLSLAPVFIMDGTFSIAPTGFKQIFTIHGCVGKKFLPYVHMLLPNKAEKSYRKALRLLKRFAKENNIRLNPDIGF